MSRDLSELVKNDYRGGLNPHELDWLVPAIERMEADAKSLRAYRDKTEAALLTYCAIVVHALDEAREMLAEGRKREVWSTFKAAARIDHDNLKELGLWREPALPKDGGA